MNQRLNQQSIDLHRHLKGKLSTQSKLPLNSKDSLSLAYTPGVAAVCQKIAQEPEEAFNLTIKNNTIAVISDGTAVLGLGNIGALAAIPVMEGKCAIFKEFAGLNAFPICLDTQDTKEVIDTIIKISPVFGGINLEDIAAPRCFEIERALQEKLSIPVFHDDQHGTATVVLAALLNAIKIKGLTRETKIVINGAGAAGLAIAVLLLEAGFSNILICDSKGILNPNRIDLHSEKQLLANRTNSQNITGSLHTALSNAAIFIGVSKGNILTPELINSMETEPVIFALANPTPEIMPDEAIKAGASIVATGRSDFPNQINNALVFPGIFRGALDNKVRKITNAMLINAAKNLSDLVPTPSESKLLPELLDTSAVSAVARAIT